MRSHRAFSSTAAGRGGVSIHRQPAASDLWFVVMRIGSVTKAQEHKEREEDRGTTPVATARSGAGR
jgi:hypothetical protein